MFIMYRAASRKADAGAPAWRRFGILRFAAPALRFDDCFSRTLASPDVALPPRLRERYGVTRVPWTFIAPFAAEKSPRSIRATDDAHLRTPAETHVASLQL